MKKKVFISNNFTKQYGIHIGIFFNLLTKSLVLVSNYPYYFDTQLNWKRPSIACTHYIQANFGEHFPKTNAAYGSLFGL